MKPQVAVIALLGLTFATTLFIAANLGGPAPTGDDDRLAAIEARLEKLEDIAADTREEVRRSARAASAHRVSVGSAVGGTRAPAVAGGDGDAAVDAAMGAADLQEVVADRVQRTVEQQMERIAAEKRHRNNEGKWQPPIDVMSKTLELSEEQRDALTRIFDGARDETFALLETRRPDGGSLLDDFARDLRNSENQVEAYMRFFGAITSKKVPGRNQTYLKAFEEASVRIVESVHGNLDSRQREHFDALQVDVFDVKTGYDPVGDYIKERLAEGTD